MTVATQSTSPKYNKFTENVYEGLEQKLVAKFDHAGQSTNANLRMALAETVISHDCPILYTYGCHKITMNAMLTYLMADQRTEDQKNAMIGAMNDLANNENYFFHYPATVAIGKYLETGLAPKEQQPVLIEKLVRQFKSNNKQSANYDHSILKNETSNNCKNFLQQNPDMQDVVWQTIENEIAGLDMNDWHRFDQLKEITQSVAFIANNIEMTSYEGAHLRISEKITGWNGIKIEPAHAVLLTPASGVDEAVGHVMMTARRLFAEDDATGDMGVQKMINERYGKAQDGSWELEAFKSYVDFFKVDVNHPKCAFKDAQVYKYI